MTTRASSSLVSFLVVLVFQTASLGQGAASDTGAKKERRLQSKWIRLFNGKNLDGWRVKFAGYKVDHNFRDTFRVEDGLLKISYDKYDRFRGEFGHIIYNKRFSHYRLRVEYRFVGEQIAGAPGWGYRNSGIMLHGEAPDEMTIEQQFPTSVEVQLLGSDEAVDRPTASVGTPGTHIVIGGQLTTSHVTNSSSPPFKGDQWVTVEVEVRGGTTIRHIVAGKTVMSYSRPQLDLGDPYARNVFAKVKDKESKILTSGYISLQAETHPIEFRKVDLLPLSE